jgi:hypothetical protein
MIKLYGIAPHWTEMSRRSDDTHCFVPIIPYGSRHCTDIDINFTIRYNIFILNQFAIEQEAVHMT